MQVRNKSEARGIMMPSDIEISSKPALNMIGMAFREIDNEEYTNPKFRKLTTI